MIGPPQAAESMARERRPPGRPPRGLGGGRCNRAGETASPKHEGRARTLRPKLYRLWEDYIVLLTPRPVRCSLKLATTSRFDLTDVPSLVRSLKVNQAVPRYAAFRRNDQAWARLGHFLDEPFARYAKNRSVQRPGRRT